MRISLLAGACALVVCTPVFAADLPSRAAPPVFVPPFPIFSWEGFYVGAQAGYAFGRDSTTASIPGTAPSAPAGGEGGGTGGGTTTFAAVTSPIFAGAPATTASASSNPSGFVAGGHVGYNLSTRSVFGGLLGPSGIIGIEGDIEGTDYQKTTAVPTIFGTSSSKIRSDIQGSIRGRLGFAFDRLLVYGTGGAAFADFKTGFSLAGADFDTYSRSRVGYTVGGGVEYAVSNNIAVRVEYRYSDFGSFPGHADTSTATLGDVTLEHHETIQRVEVGVSYLFSTPVVPVVARY